MKRRKTRKGNIQKCEHIYYELYGFITLHRTISVMCNNLNVYERKSIPNLYN